MLSGAYKVASQAFPSLTRLLNLHMFLTGKSELATIQYSVLFPGSEMMKRLCRQKNETAR